MYGDQLEIFGIDVSSSEGDMLYDAAIERFKIQKFGVPTLILGNQVLVGGAEIEESFASILEEYSVQGGLDWPDIPGLHETIAKASEPDVLTPNPSAQSGTLQTAPAPATVSPAFASPTATLGILLSDSGSSSWTEMFALDPAGNTLSVLVLVGMLGSLVWVVILFRKTNGVSRKHNWTRFIPLLCAVGFGVASYLAYVETTQVEAICGPVGHCNTVQQSEYARLFGILPIGVLGIIGYIAIFITWLLTRYASDYVSNFGYPSILAMTTTGTIFSVYLTFLEPFVIGATCAWCLTSSILMTIMMLLSVAPAKFAVKKIKASNK
jgi:uncharacterized membrane protein